MASAISIAEQKSANAVNKAVKTAERVYKKAMRIGAKDGQKIPPIRGRRFLVNPKTGETIYVNQI